MTELHEFLPVIKDLGIAAFVLFIAYRLGYHFIEKIVIPLKDAHLEFVKSLKIQLEELTRSQANLVVTLNTIGKMIEALESRLEHTER